MIYTQFLFMTFRLFVCFCFCFKNIFYLICFCNDFTKLHCFKFLKEKIQQNIASHILHVTTIQCNEKLHVILLHHCRTIPK